MVVIKKENAFEMGVFHLGKLYLIRQEHNAARRTTDYRKIKDLNLMKYKMGYYH